MTPLYRSTCPLIHCIEFDWSWYKTIKVQKRKRGNPKTKKRVQYLDIITAFDIETSRVKISEDDEQSIMYVWAYQFGLEVTVYGRTWKEFDEFITKLVESTTSNVKLVTFAHNFSYEFQFLRAVYDWKITDVFAIEKRKILKATMHDAIEWRCSYLHTNMSLALYTQKMRVEHVKQDGDDFDYNVTRYPWTPLTTKEWKYIQHDVLGLVEAIEAEMTFDGDNLYTLPLTSTGYVRRDAKRAMRKVSHYYVKDQLPDHYIYTMLHEAFRGGNTHANRYYSGRIIEGVKSADIASSYPAQQVMYKFPVTEFYHEGGVTFDRLMQIINVRKKAVVMRISITNVKLLNEFWGAPYLATYKCRNIRNGIYDNGRILSADYLETTITDIDLKIILSEYDFTDLVAFDVAHARYGYLPQALIDVTLQYYQAKTNKKNVDGEEVFYMKSKNKLNSIYGMMAQDPVKQTIDYIDGEFKERDDDEEELLYKSNGKAFLAYQWGVWVTAHARMRLEEGIRLAGENFIYCDTDSVKYCGSIDFNTYNKTIIELAKTRNAYAYDKNGIIQYMGVYEDDGSYHQFITHGAKKYAFNYEPYGDTHITVSGVNKKKGGRELDEDYEGIQSFKPDFIFNKAGGNSITYNDKTDGKYISVDGKQIDITPNACIKESTYQLGITQEYKEILLNSKVLLDKRITRNYN